MYAVYWAVIVLKGTNYPHPTAPGHKMFTGFVIVMGAAINGLVVGACASFLASLDKHKMQLRTKLDEINTYLRYHKV